MDEADRGNDHAERMLDSYLSMARKRAADGMKITGVCWNCEEPTEGRLFCDPDCREDYDYRCRTGQRTRGTP